MALMHESFFMYLAWQRFLWFSLSVERRKKKPRPGHVCFPVKHVQAHAINGHLPNDFDIFLSTLLDRCWRMLNTTWQSSFVKKPLLSRVVFMPGKCSRTSLLFSYLINILMIKVHKPIIHNRHVLYLITRVGHKEGPGCLWLSIAGSRHGDQGSWDGIRITCHCNQTPQHWDQQ